MRIVLLLILLLSAKAYAEDITLAWDPSPDPVTGYRIYYSTSDLLVNSTGASTIDVGRDVLQKVIPNLTANTNYYFALKAFYYNNWSSFSNQVMYKTKVTGSVPIKPTGVGLSLI